MTQHCEFEFAYDHILELGDDEKELQTKISASFVADSPALKPEKLEKKRRTSTHKENNAPTPPPKDSQSLRFICLVVYLVTHI